MDEHGKWLPKARKVYDLDENGERIRLPSGNWKSHKENTVDWNERKYGMAWRMGWQDFQNKYLVANGRPERVDLRSYDAQGIDQIPTVHMGPAVTAMERRGIQTDIGNLNREIRKTNSIMQSIKKIIANLREWLVELNECRKELIAEQAAYEASMLPALLMKYLDIRKDERKDWTPHGRSKAASQDLKKVTEAIGYLKRQGLHTVDDLEAHIENSGKDAADLRGQMRTKEQRVKTIDTILLSLETYKECKPIYEQYQKIHFKKSKEKFKQEHPEVAKFERARAVLSKHPEAKTTTAKELKKESAKLLDAQSFVFPLKQSRQICKGSKIFAIGYARQRPVRKKARKLRRSNPFTSDWLTILKSRPSRNRSPNENRIWNSNRHLPFSL